MQYFLRHDVRHNFIFQTHTQTQWFLRIWRSTVKCKMKRRFRWFTLNVPHHFTLSVLRLFAWPCTSLWHFVKWERIHAREQIGNNTTLGLWHDWWASAEPRAWTLIHILAFPLKFGHTSAAWVSRSGWQVGKYFMGLNDSVSKIG